MGSSKDPSRVWYRHWFALIAVTDVAAAAGAAVKIPVAAIADGAALCAFCGTGGRRARGFVQAPE